MLTSKTMKMKCFLVFAVYIVWLCSAQRDQEFVLTNEVVDGKRILVIGDTHGCFDELIALLQEAEMIDITDNSLYEDAIVIFAGDFINKGPYSLEVVRWLMTQYSAGKGYAATGNHEITPGGDWVNDATDEELNFLATLPYTVSIPMYNTRVVHAGLMPNWALADQTEYIMTLMRNLEDDGQGGWIPHEETDFGENWGTVYSREDSDPEFVVYGHDARRGHDEDGNIVIQEHDSATGLDTRCVKGGELTGLLLMPPFRTYFSVQCEPYDPFFED